MPKSKIRPPSKGVRSSRPDPRELIEEAVSSCRAIEVLAQLLDLAGATDLLEGEVASEAGWMITRHAQSLHQTLKTLQKNITP